jgi:hypothetical protein
MLGRGWGEESKNNSPPCKKMPLNVARRPNKSIFFCRPGSSLSLRVLAAKKAVKRSPCFFCSESTSTYTSLPKTAGKRGFSVVPLVWQGFAPFWERESNRDFPGRERGFPAAQNRPNKSFFPAVLDYPTSGAFSASKKAPFWRRKAPPQSKHSREPKCTSPKINFRVLAFVEPLNKVLLCNPVVVPQLKVPKFPILNQLQSISITDVKYIGNIACCYNVGQIVNITTTHSSPLSLIIFF